MPRVIRPIALLALLALFVIASSGCASSDASLQSLSIESITLSPAFTGATFDYTSTKNIGANSMVTRLTAMPTSSQATLRLKVGTAGWVDLTPGQASADFTLPVGTTNVIVEVTAGDDTIRLYTVVVTLTHIVYA